MRPATSLTLLLLLPIAACGGGEGDGGSGPAPTGALHLATSGLPAGYTAPYTVRRDGMLLASAALTAGDSVVIPALPFGTYAVQWGPRVTQTGGDNFTWGAPDDTVEIAAVDTTIGVTGRYVPLTGGLVFEAVGPVGSTIWYKLEPIAGGPAVVAWASAGVAWHTSNLRPGTYRVVPHPSTNRVDGLTREVTSDTLQALVTAGALDTVRPVLRPLEAVLEVVVVGLPPGATAFWGLTDVGGSWSIVGSAGPGGSYHLIPRQGQGIPDWSDVVIGDTTYLPSFNAGPVSIRFGFPVLRTDTVRYAPQ